MKRLAAIVALAAAFSVSGTAFAETINVGALYNGSGSIGNNSATVSGTGYSTILITQDESPNDVVYVNQADGSFTDATAFLLKSGAEPGWYTVRVGNAGGDTGTTKLYIYGVDKEDAGDLPMTRLQGEEESSKSADGNEKYNIGYYATVSVTDYNNDTYSYIKVGYTDGATTTYGGFELKDGDYPSTTVSGDASVRLIFQLNNVNKEYADSIGVFLSSSLN